MKMPSGTLGVVIIRRTGSLPDELSVDDWHFRFDGGRKPTEEEIPMWEVGTSKAET
jgi:hypothetical protein